MNVIEEIVEDAESLAAKVKSEFSPAVQTEVKAVENAGHAIVSDAVTYIKANGLSDLEQLAIVFVSALAPGASWSTMLVALKTQAVADGIKLVDGAEAVVAAKVQADLLVQGKVATPVASTASSTSGTAA